MCCTFLITETFLNFLNNTVFFLYRHGDPQSTGVTVTTIAVTILNKYLFQSCKDFCQ